MPIGRPDWYNTGKSENVATLNDMAELAVRLGSALNYDRTAKTIHVDTFTRYDALYEENFVGGASTWAVVTTHGETGGASLHSQLNVGASNYAYLGRYFRTWQNGKISLEIGLFCDQIPAQILMELEINDNNETWEGRVKLDNGSQDIKIISTGGATVDSGEDFNSPFNHPFFVALKLDVDMSLREYIRFRVNDKTVDLSGQSMYQSGSGLDNHLRAMLTVYGNAASAVNIYVDRFIFTEDE